MKKGLMQLYFCQMVIGGGLLGRLLRGLPGAGGEARGRRREVRGGARARVGSDEGCGV